MRMKWLTSITLALVALTLSGCITAKEFLNSSDPCGAAESIHTAFLAFAANTPKVQNNAKLLRSERTGIATVRQYCSDGDISKPTLQKLVNAYIAAVSEYRK
jgi:hypothetical protein